MQGCGDRGVWGEHGGTWVGRWRDPRGTAWGCWVVQGCCGVSQPGDQFGAAGSGGAVLGLRVGTGVAEGAGRVPQLPDPESPAQDPRTPRPSPTPRGSRTLAPPPAPLPQDPSLSAPPGLCRPRPQAPPSPPRLWSHVSGDCGAHPCPTVPTAAGTQGTGTLYLGLPVAPAKPDWDGSEGGGDHREQSGAVGLRDRVSRAGAGRARGRGGAGHGGAEAQEPELLQEPCGERAGGEQRVGGSAPALCPTAPQGRAALVLGGGGQGEAARTGRVQQGRGWGTLPAAGGAMRPATQRDQVSGSAGGQRGPPSPTPPPAPRPLTFLRT